MKEKKTIEIIQSIKQKIQSDLANSSIVNKKTLAIVRVGDNSDDIFYQKNIQKIAKSVHIDVSLHELPTTILTSELCQLLKSLSFRADIDGILLLKPLPTHINEEMVNKAIIHNKDVDCVTQENQWKNYLSIDGNKPNTAESAYLIAKSLEPNLVGKNVVIVNRSMVIGKPLAMMLLEEDCTVTIAHSKTKNLKELIKNADILITGIGKPKFIDEQYTHKNLIIIDCGISFENGKVVGDCDYDNLKDKVKAITPVPGGVGSLTTLLLLNSLERR